jgi:hypothetical protein
MKLTTVCTYIYTYIHTHRHIHLVEACMIRFIPSCMELTIVYIYIYIDTYVYTHTVCLRSGSPLEGTTGDSIQHIEITHTHIYIYIDTRYTFQDSDNRRAEHHVRVVFLGFSLTVPRSCTLEVYTHAHTYTHTHIQDIYIYTHTNTHMYTYMYNSASMYTLST